MFIQTAFVFQKKYGVVSYDLYTNSKNVINK